MSLADRTHPDPVIQRLLDWLRGVHKQPLPFATGWANFGGGNEDATYSRIGRLVVLQGRVTKTAGVPGVGDVIGTLPVGFRPAEDLGPFAVGSGATLGFGAVDVLPSGSVRWLAGSTTETDYTSLSGITFIVD